MSWIRKQIERLLAEARQRSRLLTGGIIAAAVAALVVTAALAQGATAERATGSAAVEEQMQEVAASSEHDYAIASINSVADSGNEIADLQPLDDKQVQASDGETIDGQSYLSSLVVQKYDSEGNLQTFDYTSEKANIGETYNLAMTFEFGNNVLTSEKRTVVYCLPDGVLPLKDSSGNNPSGNIYNGSNRSDIVGTYTISQEDRTVTLVFNPDFVEHGSSTTSTVRFDGNFSNDSSKDERVIKFTGKMNPVPSITVKPADINITKSVTNGSGTSRYDAASGTWYRDVNYQVDVSTTNGTGNHVQISDIAGNTTNVNESGWTYNISSFSLQKQDARGNKIGHAIPDGQPVISTVDRKPSFTLDGLDALLPGEHYILSYSVSIPEVNHSASSSSAQNNASATILSQDETIIKSVDTSTATNWSFSPDINLAKKHSTPQRTADEKWRIPYTLTIGTTNGTGGTHLEIDDHPTSTTNIRKDSNWETTGFYEGVDGFTVTKVAADGVTRTEIDKATYNVRFGTQVLTTNTLPQFSIDGLPPLSGGEKYEITYNALVTEEDPTVQNSAVNNSAVVRVHDDSHNVERSATATDGLNWMTNDIDKSASFDAARGTINWIVWINRFADDPSGIVMTDDLSEVGDLTGNINIVYARGGRNTTFATIALGDADANGTKTGENNGVRVTYSASKVLTVTMPDNMTVKNNEYQIQFSTIAPASGTVSNFATETKGIGRFRSRTATPTITRESSYSVSKTKGSDNAAMQDNGTWRFSWSAVANMPDQDLPSGDKGGIAYTFSDTFNAPSYDGSTADDDVRHYAVARELYQDLTNGAVSLSLHGLDQNTYTYSNGSFRNGSLTLDGIGLVVVLFGGPDGNTEIENPTESNEFVSRFELRISCEAGHQVNGRQLRVTNYHTLLSTTGVPQDTQVTIRNTASIGGLSNSTSQTVTTPNAERIKKQARAFNDSNWNDSDWRNFNKTGGWVDNGLTINYDNATSNSDKGRYVQFRILINTYGNHSDHITVTDTLPEGMTLVRDATQHPVRLFRQDPSNSNTIYEVDGALGDGNGASAVNRYSYDEASRTVTFIINTTKTDQEGSKGQKMPPGEYFITYTAAFNSDSAWNNITTNDRSYTNSASWNDNRTSTTVNVHRQPTAMDKNGQQLFDSEGNPTDTVRYTIEINPSSQDLDPKSDTLTLTDNLSWNSTIMDPQANLRTVHLYAYDSSKSDHIGQEVSSRNYMVRYESSDGTTDAKRQLVITVPDSTAYVLQYDFNLSAGTSGHFGNNASVANSVSMKGQTSSSKSIGLQWSTSSAVATNHELYVYKVDQDNHTHFLDGAEFDLYTAQVSRDSPTWGNKLNTQPITLNRTAAGNDGSGSIKYHLFDLGNSEGGNINTPDTLYKLQETKAPAGYGIGSPTYIVYLGENETAEQAFNAISNKMDLKGLDDGITMDSIHFIPHVGGSLYIEDPYSSITVAKSWSASDGTPLPPDNEDIPSSIKVKLQRTEVSHGATTANANANWEDVGIYTLESRRGVTFTFGTSIGTSETSFSDADSDKWTYTWQNLPAGNGRTGDAARDYLYRVVEADDSGNWKATYLNDGGIKTGNITINNTRQYSLPSTGGIPLRTLTTVGTVMVLVAGALLAIRRVARR